MKHTLLIIYLIYPVSFVLNAQEKEKQASFVVSDQVNINKAVLPFANYFSDYRLNDSWSMRVENLQTNFGGFSTSYGIKEFPLLAKYSFTEKFSALFGPTTNLLLKNGVIKDVSTSGTIGVQYDFNESFLMEARMNYNLNNNSLFKENLPSTNSLFNLRGKYKF